MTSPIPTKGNLDIVAAGVIHELPLLMTVYAAVTNPFSPRSCISAPRWGVEFHLSGFFSRKTAKKSKKKYSPPSGGKGDGGLGGEMKN